jgi:uncharacterized protein
LSSEVVGGLGKCDTDFPSVPRGLLWTFGEDRIAVRFQHEWNDAAGVWFRSHGNELWEFDSAGLMHRREASINDVVIAESERTLFGPRADGDDARIPIR